MTTIYILKDPNTHEIRYVGKTVNIKRRYYQHTNKKFQERTKTYVSNWILSLLKNNQKPIIEIVEQCLNWEEREIYWIAYYKNLGFNLCNLAEGGRGCKGYKKTEEQKKRHSEAFKGKNNWMKGRIFTKEHCKNISKATTKGKNPSAKRVINTETNEIFDTITDAAESINLKRTTLVAMLTGQNKNKTKLKYL